MPVYAYTEIIAVGDEAAAASTASDIQAQQERNSDPLQIQDMDKVMPGKIPNEVSSIPKVLIQVRTRAKRVAEI